MPTILPLSHLPAWHCPRPLHGHPPATVGQALAEYALTIVLCTLIIAPALHLTLVVLMAYYQLLIVAAAGG